MTNRRNTSTKIEENLYQILDVTNTANLVDIRQAYEGKLEETHLETSVNPRNGRGIQFLDNGRFFTRILSMGLQGFEHLVGPGNQ